MTLKLPEKIEIIDVTMRDGLQNEEIFVPLDGKLYIANKLIAAGVKRIEVGSLSHVKYVPQFKDIDELLFQLPRREDVEYTILALNAKAVERAVKLVEQGAKIDRVLTGQIATSEAYARKNMNRTHEELFADAEINVKRLHDAGIKKVVANIGTIFGCPIQGDVPIERAYEFVDRCLELGFDEIEHSDPDGKATPKDITEYFEVIMSRHQDASRHSFQVANFVDRVPVKGIGEYYFDSRRTGLVSTEDFVTMANDMGIVTGIDEKILYGLGMDLEKMLGRKLSSFTSSLRSTSGL